jgi:hypothetical protein
MPGEKPRGSWGWKPVPLESGRTRLISQLKQRNDAKAKRVDKVTDGPIGLGTRPSTRMAKRSFLLVLGRASHPASDSSEDQRTHPPPRPHPQPRAPATPARPDRLRTLPRHHRCETRATRRLRQALANQPLRRRRTAPSRRGRQLNTRPRRQPPALLSPRPTRCTHRASGGAWTFGFSDSDRYEVAVET